MFKSILISLVILLSATVGHTQLGLGGAGGETAASAFTANAVDFDGTNDFLTRGADLTGAADNDNGIISFWVRVDGGAGLDRVILADPGFDHHIFKGTGDTPRLSIHGTLNELVLNDVLSVALAVDADWHHILIGWDSNGTCFFFFDDAVQTVDTCATASVSAEGNATDWFIGSNTAPGTLVWDGCMAEFYYDQDSTLDFSVESNRRLFRDADGKPVDLGSDGSTPTSSQPIIYLNGDETGFQTNAGSGGNFSVTGGLSACSTSPSD